MNIRKNFAAILLSLTLLLTSVSSALAKNYTDVPDNYWAAEEIDDVVTKNVVPLFGDQTFRPLEKVTRVDWTDWLLRALGLSQAPITAAPNYSEKLKQLLL